MEAGARVDSFLGTAPDGSGRLVSDEVDTMPGVTPISVFPRGRATGGVDCPGLVDRLIATALATGARPAR